MKFLKPVLLGLSAVVALSLSAQEKETHKTPAEKAAKHSAHIADKYSLSDEQTVKVEAAQLEFMTVVQKIKQDESLTGEVRKSQILAAKDVRDGTMKSVLTDEQYGAFTADVDAKIEKKKAKRAEHNTPEAKAKRKTDHMFSTLTDLTEEQKTQIKDLNLKVENKIFAVKANETLTSDQKIEFIKGNRNDRKMVLQTILTDAQLAQLKETKHVQKDERKKMKEADTDIK